MSLLASRCTIVRPRSRNALFFFNDTATTEIYTLSLHDALPISPAGDRQPTPSAVSGTRGRDHHHVAPVGQEMRARRYTVRSAEAPDDRRDELADVSGGLYLFGTRPGDCNAPGCPFLEEQLGRLDARLGVKAGAHHPLMEGIRERDQHHSLMVRHVATDDRHARALREPGSSIVEGLVEPVRTARAGFRQALEVPDGGRRIEHRRPPRRIRGEGRVGAEPP